MILSNIPMNLKNIHVVATSVQFKQIPNERKIDCGSDENRLNQTKLYGITCNQNACRIPDLVDKYYANMEVTESYA